jgi:hypothetical protein
MQVGELDVAGACEITPQALAGQRERRRPAVL